MNLWREPRLRAGNHCTDRKTPSNPQCQRGSVTVIAVTLLAVSVILVGVISAWGQAVTSQIRLEASVQVVALRSAVALNEQGLDAKTACAQAATWADLLGYQLDYCEVLETDIRLMGSRQVQTLGIPTPVTARARAGPNG